MFPTLNLLVVLTSQSFQWQHIPTLDNYVSLHRLKNIKGVKIIALQLKFVATSTASLEKSS